MEKEEETRYRFESYASIQYIVKEGKGGGGLGSFNPEKTSTSTTTTTTHVNHYFQGGGRGRKRLQKRPHCVDNCMGLCVIKKKKEEEGKEELL